MLALKVKILAVLASFRANDWPAFAEGLGGLVVELLLALLAPTPFMGATPEEKAEFAAAVAEFETCCTAPPMMGTDGAQAIDPERWARIAEIMKLVASLLKMFI